MSRSQLWIIIVSFMLSAVIGSLSGYFLVSNTPIFESNKNLEHARGYNQGFEKGKQQLIKILDDTLISILDKHPESIMSTYQNPEGSLEARGVIRQIDGNKLTIFINKEKTGQIPTIDGKLIEVIASDTTQILEKQSLSGHTEDYMPGNINKAKVGQFVVVALNQPTADGTLTMKKLLLWPKVYSETF